MTARIFPRSLSNHRSSERATKVSFCIRASRTFPGGSKCSSVCVRPASPNRTAPSRARRSKRNRPRLIGRLVARAPSAEVIATVQLALNAIVMEVDGGDLAELARDTAITRVVGVSDYAHDLSEHRAVHRRGHGTLTRRHGPGCSRCRDRQRHRLHAQESRRTRHAGRVRSGVGAASGSGPVHSDGSGGHGLSGDQRSGHHCGRRPLPERQGHWWLRLRR